MHFQLLGWHYGRTTGLWGSYNNEQFDDLTTPNGLKINSSTSQNLAAFADSWAVNEDCQTKTFQGI